MQPSQRATLHVDVGPELSARLRAAAAAGGRTPSEWTRELLQRELARAGASADAERPVPATNCDSFLRFAKLTKPPMADSATPGPAGVFTFLLRLKAATMPQ